MSAATATSALEPSISYNYTFKPDAKYIEQRPKKLILTVDGGGLRGMIPARLLEELEVVIKQHIIDTPELYESRPAPEVAAIKKGEFNIHLADYFDVMSGTSTGSIITAYLASKGDLGKALLSGDEDVTALDEQRKVKLTPEEQAKKKKGDAETKAIEVDFNPNGDAQLKAVLDRFHKDNLVPGSCRAIQAMFVAKANRIFPKDRIEQGERTLLESAAEKLLKKPGATALLHAAMEVKYGEAGINDSLQKAFKSPINPPKAGEEPGLLSNSLHTSLIIPTIQLDKSRTVSFFYHHDTRQQGYATLRRGATEEEKTEGDIMAHEQLYPSYMDSKAVKEKEEGLQLAGTPDLIYCKSKDFDLWQVVRSSTAAPTYFPPCELKPYDVDDKTGKRQLIPDETWHMSDGGVTSNNPGMSAVVFASAIYKDVQNLEDLAVLSLGCGTRVGPVKVNQNDGLLGWAAQLIGLLMGGNQELSSALVEHFVTFPYKNLASKDPSDRFVRIQKTADMTAVVYKTGPDGKPTTTVEKDPTGATEVVKIGKAKEATVGELLGKMDDANCMFQYHELAERMLRDEENLKIKAQLKAFVADYVLPSKKVAVGSAKPDVRTSTDQGVGTHTA